MKLSCKDEKFKGKKLVMLDRSTFQSLTLDQLNQMCEQYAILCTPNFLYECLKGNLEKGLLNIENDSFVMICESPEKSHIFQSHQNNIVKRDMISSDDYLVTLRCINKKFRKSILSEISKYSDDFYDASDLHSKFYDKLYGGFREHVINMLGGDKIVARNLLKEGEKELGYRLMSSKINDICKFAESHIPQPQELIRFFNSPIKADGTGIINGEEMVWALKRLSLYNNRPIDTHFLWYSRYYYFLGLCLQTFRAFEGEHRDDSYVQDWEYLYFLPFCDLFVSGDNFFEHFVPSLPESFGLNNKFITTDTFCQW